MASTEFLNQAYLAYFGRPMDFTGSIAFANSTEEDVEEAFFASAESQDLYGTTIDATFINAVYENLFGRTAEADGMAYWLNQYYTGALTAAGVALAILNGAQGTDATAVENKLAASLSFYEGLDTNTEVLGYNTAEAAESARAWLATVTDTAATATEIDDAIAAASATTTTSSTIYLDTDVETTTGTSAADTFKAYIFDNDNSLQSGDVINGGAGIDTLYAKIGNSQAFAINAETTGVEIVQIRAQAVSEDSTDNNTETTSEVQIDAQDMVGVTWWESNNSRADLLIEDVRILDAQITKDITIAFVESDPGNVDYAVYFDQYSLRTTTSTSSTLSLELMDTRTAAAGGDPLTDNPYWGFAFVLTLADGSSEVIGITSQAIDDATTYAELLAAIQEAIVANEALIRLGLTDAITASLGADFEATDTDTGIACTGQTIVITTTTGTISLDPDAYGLTDDVGWVTQGAVPGSSGLHTDMSTDSSSNTDLVTSTIVLDDVGRGSTGGDLVVGGLSTGKTSDSLGVQRFEIEVRDNSKLQTISSTNNTLQEVVITNGETTSSSSAYVTVEENAGDLTVNGSNNSLTSNEALPGSDDEHNGYGFTDVRLIDATAMTGNLAFTAAITEASIEKYMDLLDTASALSSADVVNFEYLGGSNDDTLVVTIDGDVMASNSNILAGREDFTFTASGNAGDDNITVYLTNDLDGGDSAWYNNQKLNANVFVNGGSGDDTLLTYGSGDAIISGGEGNDAIYTDNSGTDGLSYDADQDGTVDTLAPRAVFVFNTYDQAGDVTTTEYKDLGDIESGENNSYDADSTVGTDLAQVVVTFKGISVTVDISAYTDGTTDDLQINQAIKNAINNDDVLSKLLVATDGPANALVVTSLIDGEMTTTDLTVGFLDYDGNAYVLGTTDYDTAFAETGDYTYESDGTTAAVNADTEITGDDSTATSDNTIDGGTGDDVIVLGTTGDGTTGSYGIDIGDITDEQMLYSNDTVVFSGTATDSIGNDTIVNFVIDADGVAGTANDGFDVLDFSAYAADDLTLQAMTTDVDDTAANLADTYVEGTAEYTELYIAYNSDNVASVYLIVDGTAAADATVTLLGTVDLADTEWADLATAYAAGTSSIAY